jgi:hypothetical protein
MNTNIYNVNNDNFKNSIMYKEYLKDNSSYGHLKIRVYAASEAVPIEGVRVIVTGNIKNNKVIFFDGFTDESGIIEKIQLPAPKLDPNNLEKPLNATYEIYATYLPDNISKTYLINMYEDVCVVQNISIIPEMGDY